MSIRYVLLMACLLAYRVVAGADPALLADFEPGSTNPFAGGAVERQPALGGEGALRVAAGSIHIDRPMDWSRHDFLHVEAFNPGSAPATVWIEIRDAQTKGYWTRVNLSTVAPPGRSRISLPLNLYVGEKSRPGRALLRDQVTRFAVTVEEGGVLFLDDFRFETLDTSRIRLPGVVALDFGPAGSPVMEGFDAHADQAWDEAIGRGWVDARLWRSVNALQPEPLTQDFVCPEAGRFRFRVSNGLHRVGFNVQSPKGYWGETQTYRHRRVQVNGRTVLEDEQDFDLYLARYFAHAEREDLPGASAFAHYVEEPLAGLWTTVEVTNGFVELAFEGQGWAICLTHLISYPADQEEAGARFRVWTEQRRRFHFENYFKQLPVARSGQGAPPEGFRLFRRHFMDTVGPLDGPRDGEALGAGATLAAQAAGGEEVALTFSVQPASTSGVPAVLMAEAPRNAKGAELGPGTLAWGWIDYRFARVAMDGSIYDIRPRYWRTGAPPAAPGVTRRFWLRWQPSPEAEPGVYTGRVELVGTGLSIPVSLEVLPFALAPVERLAVGPWGSGIAMGWFGDDPATRAWDDRMFAAALDALKGHGFTSLSGRPHVQVVYTNGGFALDTERADREMALLKAKGFRHLISSYGIQKIGYSLYHGPTEAEWSRAGFTNASDFVGAVFRQLESHALENRWLPVAWNLCDEPIGGDIPPATHNALLHRAAAGKLRMHTFMGATSMRGSDTNDTHYALVQALPMPTLTLHDEASIGVLREAGNRFAYYNGGDRWTYGRYMKMLEDRHALELRLNWHYNVAAGDPYFALDCREDDYCWYSSNPAGELIPSLNLLQEMVPGLNDYRHLLTLEGALARRPDAPGAGAARAILADVMALRAGTNAREGSVRLKAATFFRYDEERAQVIQAILNLESGAD